MDNLEVMNQPVVFISAEYRQELCKMRLLPVCQAAVVFYPAASFNVHSWQILKRSSHDCALRRWSRSHSLAIEPGTSLVHRPVSEAAIKHPDPVTRTLNWCLKLKGTL